MSTLLLQLGQPGLDVGVVSQLRVNYECMMLRLLGVPAAHTIGSCQSRSV